MTYPNFDASFGNVDPYWQTISLKTAIARVSANGGVNLAGTVIDLNAGRALLDQILNAISAHNAAYRALGDPTTKPPVGDEGTMSSLIDAGIAWAISVNPCP